MLESCVGLEKLLVHHSHEVVGAGQAALIETNRDCCNRVIESESFVHLFHKYLLSTCSSTETQKELEKTRSLILLNFCLMDSKGHM